MPSSKKAGMFYFGIHEKWILDKFTLKEIALFFKDGKGFFEYLDPNPESLQYLEDHPEFAEVLKKW